MGLFDFLNPKKKEMPISIFADNLTLKEKAAIYITMLFMVSQQGNRKPHQEEIKYIDTIRQSILGLTDKDMKPIKVESLNFPDVINAMSDSNKDYFASVFYGLSTIVHDQPIVKTMSIIVGDMGFSVEELSQKEAQTQNEINNNPYMSDRFKTRK
jgi:hypothetical protein